MDALLNDALTGLAHLFSPSWYAANWVALLNVIMIDVTLAGDNAIVVGLAASRVAPEHRAKVIYWGIAAAVVLRIFFAAVTTQLLAIVGLTLAGGILLLWVCWKMYRQLIGGADHTLENAGLGLLKNTSPEAQLGFGAAVFQVALADISMSLDNVLAVAGVAKGEPLVLIIGLAVAIILMAVASHYIAGLLVKYPWISWIGLLIIIFVAVDMIYTGSHEVACKAYDFGCSETLWQGIKHRLGFGGT